MDDLNYFHSITQELNALKNRVRYFIKDRHWSSDGLWKESVLRAVLRRHLPKSLGVGSGFIVTDANVSSQIDVLIYDTGKPILFKDGDFVVVTPDLVQAIIEVKTRVQGSDLRKALQKLSVIHTLSRSTKSVCKPFVGLFAYENAGCGYELVLDALEEAASGHSHRTVHCVSLGDDLFTRYWYSPPETPNKPDPMWRSYQLNGSAPAYFVHNVIEGLCERSVIENNGVWFPHRGKEMNGLGERRWKQAQRRC